MDKLIQWFLPSMISICSFWRILMFEIILQTALNSDLFFVNSMLASQVYRKACTRNIQRKSTKFVNPETQTFKYQSNHFNMIPKQLVQLIMLNTSFQNERDYYNIIGEVALGCQSPTEVSLSNRLHFFSQAVRGGRPICLGT